MPAPVQIMPVQTAADRRRFIQFPWQVYRGAQPDPLWVPPLISERKTFFDPAKGAFYQHAEVQLFLALRGQALVGTISAHINHLHNQTHHEQIGFFGFFEVLDDPEAAQALLQAAAGWVRERGYQAIRGPMNFSINDECGLLVEGFDSPPVAMMTYNPPRYITYIEQAGFKKCIDLYAWMIDDQTYRGDKVVAGEQHKLMRVIEAVSKKSNLTFRNFDLNHFQQEIDLGWEIYNQAWAGNWGAIPMTKAEFNHLAHSFKPFLDPEIMFIAEVDGNAVGLLIAIPDVNIPLRHLNGRLLPFGWVRFLWHRRQIDTMRIIIMGVLPQYRRRGIDAMFYQKIKQAGVRRGYFRAEMSWILETNDLMNHAIAKLGGHRY
ncbi:MAG: N-acetyltransferase, partial [Herpetosiphonaceae bacterium]|nr:N-acetyltransferase [Herpetosiphonaceae bacterium]